MYPFILCFCGRAIGDIYDLFCVLRAAKYAAKYAELGIDIDPTAIPIVETIQVDLSDIFEILNLHMDCCRNHIQTQVEFKSIY